MKLQKYQTSWMIWNITSDKVLLTESEPTILMAEWLTKAQGRLFHEATRQSHPLTGAEKCDPLRVCGPQSNGSSLPVSFWRVDYLIFFLVQSNDKWITWSLRIFVDSQVANQLKFPFQWPFLCISRGSIALQQHVRPSFWSSWWVVSWSNFRYCAYQITEIVSIQQRAHSYLRSVHLSSTWYFKLYIYIYIYM